MDLGAANRKSFIFEGRVGFVARGALSDPRVLRQKAFVPERDSQLTTD